MPWSAGRDVSSLTSSTWSSRTDRHLVSSCASSAAALISACAPVVADAGRPPLRLRDIVQRRVCGDILRAGQHE
eukprot:7016624-Pyramimonas_sp.AAC.1